MVEGEEPPSLSPRAAISDWYWRKLRRIGEWREGEDAKRGGEGVANRGKEGGRWVEREGGADKGRDEQQVRKKGIITSHIYYSVHNSHT